MKKIIPILLVALLIPVISFSATFKPAGKIDTYQNLLCNAEGRVFSHSDNIYKIYQGGVSITSVAAGVVTLASAPTNFNIELGQIFSFGGDAVAGVSCYEVTAMSSATSFTLDGGIGIDTGVTDAYLSGPGRITADGYAWDHWGKQGTMDIYRVQSISGITRPGVPYAMLLDPSAAGDHVYFPVQVADPSFLKMIRGKKMAFGCWVKSTGAATIRMVDNVQNTIASSKHSGSGEWEWLECFGTFDKGIGYAYVSVLPATSVDAYMSSPMLVYGDRIGEGNYVPVQNEIIWLTATNTVLKSVSSTSITATKTVYLSSETSGKIGYGAKAAFAVLQGACAVADKNINVGQNIELAGYSQVANITRRIGGWFRVVYLDKVIITRNDTWAGVYLWMYGVQY